MNHETKTQQTYNQQTKGKEEMKNITLEKVLTVLAVAIGGLFLMYTTNPELMDLSKILEAVAQFLKNN